MCDSTYDTGEGGGVRTVISIVWLMGEGRGIIREEAKEI